MLEVDLGVRPFVETECRGSFVGADPEQRVGRDDVPAQSEPARDPLQLSEFLERVDAHVRVRADADGDAALEDTLDREVAVAKIRLGCGADADARAALREEIELRVVGMLRTELVARLHNEQEQGKSPLEDVDLDKLAQILAGKASPPSEESA